MKSTIVSSVAIAATLAVQPVQAQDIRTYNPDSAWALDYGEDYCRLLRDFTDGDDRISLLLERSHPNATMRVIVVGDSIRLFRGADTIGMRFTPSGSPRMASRSIQETGDGQQYLDLGAHAVFDLGPGFGAAPAPPPAGGRGRGSGGPPGGGSAAAAAAGAFGEFTPGTPIYSREMERETAAGITGILLQDGLINPVQIETGSLGNPIQALQDCADDMVTYWGLDAEAHKTQSRTVVPGDGTLVDENGAPRNPSAGWIAQNTVNFRQFSVLTSGKNAIRVMVSAEGRPTGCFIHFASLPYATNESICEQVMANGTFQPALDADGQPMDSYWVTNVFALTPPFGR